MKRLPLFVATLAALFFLMAKTTLAHVQPGPPYLAVNGQYADTASVFAAIKLVPAQDLAKNEILVGKSAEFKVDLDRLTLPPTVLAGSRWQWVWDHSGNESDVGSKIAHVYQKAGSHLVTLQISDLASGNAAWQSFDTVQVNVVPKTPYTMPNVAVTEESSKDDSGNRTGSFTATAEADASTKVAGGMWDFGDGTVAKGVQVQHVYKPYLTAMFVTARVTDSNGVFNDTAWKLDGEGALTKQAVNFEGANIVEKGGVPGWILITLVVGTLAGISVTAWKLMTISKRSGSS